MLRYDQGDVFVVLGRVFHERIDALIRMGQRQYTDLMQLAEGG
jgi:hypothetical protein